MKLSVLRLHRGIDVVVPIIWRVAQSSEGAWSLECEPWAFANPLSARIPAARPRSLATIVNCSVKKKEIRSNKEDRHTMSWPNSVQMLAGLSSFAVFAPIGAHRRNCKIILLHRMFPIQFDIPTCDGLREESH